MPWTLAIGSRARLGPGDLCGHRVSRCSGVSGWGESVRCRGIRRCCPGWIRSGSAPMTVAVRAVGAGDQAGDVLVGGSGARPLPREPPQAVAGLHLDPLPGHGGRRAGRPGGDGEPERRRGCRSPDGGGAADTGLVTTGAAAGQHDAEPGQQGTARRRRAAQASGEGQPSGGDHLEDRGRADQRPPRPRRERGPRWLLRRERPRMTSPDPCVCLCLRQTTPRIMRCQTFVHRLFGLELAGACRRS